MFNRYCVHMFLRDFQYYSTVLIRSVMRKSISNDTFFDKNNQFWTSLSCFGVNHINRSLKTIPYLTVNVKVCLFVCLFGAQFRHHPFWKTANHESTSAVTLQLLKERPVPSVITNSARVSSIRFKWPPQKGRNYNLPETCSNPLASVITHCLVFLAKLQLLSVYVLGKSQ